MSRVPLIAPENAPAKSREILNATQAKIRMIPNLYRALAASPAALQAYVQMAETLSTGVLPAQTRERLAVAIAEANRCEYCLSAHTALGKMAGVPEQSILDARQGRAGEPKTQAILELARKMVLQRGQLGEGDFAMAEHAGITHAEIAEIAAHVGLNTFSNYFNNLVDTDIDFPRVQLRSAAASSD